MSKKFQNTFPQPDEPVELHDMYCVYSMCKQVKLTIKIQFNSIQ